MEYLIGQRVILNNSEIGTVYKSESRLNNDGYVWVFTPSKNYASKYNKINVKPLPNEQLL